MTHNQSVSGGCLCGAIAFSANLPYKWCAHCHCTMCRRGHGAGFVTWVGFQDEEFSLEEGEDHLTWFESSPGAHRGFCHRCGSTMFFRSERWPGEIHVALAALDAQDDIHPQANVYYDQRVGWVAIDESLKTVNPD